MSSTTSSNTDRSGERGQVLVLFAGGLVALLLVAALAFDIGSMLVNRRDEQNAADAAALAGARYVLTDAVVAESAARQVALLNGYDDADPDEVVLVHIPAIHGRYVGLPGFIEVEVGSTRPSIFAGVIGRGTWPTGAMAVATNSQDLTFPFSMLALNPTACKAIAVSGQGFIDAYENIQSNSNGSGCGAGDPTGFSRTGGATIQVHAPDATCRVVGEFQDEGSGPPITCSIAENSFALPDPLRNLPDPVKPGLAAPMVFAGTGTAPPIPANCPGGSPAPSEGSPQKCRIPAGGSSANVPWILYPGLYPGGLQVDKGRTAYLMPGIYWIGGGGVDVGGGGSIITIGTETDATPDPMTNPCATATTTAGLCGGVLLFNSTLPAAAGGPFVLNTGGAIMKLATLNLPSGDPNAIYNNITIFQDRTMTNPLTINGSASSMGGTIVEGIVYVPGAQIKLNGNGGTLILDQVIADTYDIKGDNGTIQVIRGTGVDAVIVAAGLVD